MKILITGAAGFIGFSLSKALALQDHDVVGLDNLGSTQKNNSIGKDRLKELGVLEIKENKSLKSVKYKKIEFLKADINDEDQLKKIFTTHHFDMVIHLAAKTGVRSAPEENTEYVNSNVLGFTNIIEKVREYSIKGFIYASSSSVYGDTRDRVLSTSSPLNKPLNIYATTKQSDELIAQLYHNLYGTPSIGLRFFTVYGPWSRTDMAMYNFAEALYSGDEIQLFNEGNMVRDFTFIDDVIHAFQLILKESPIKGQRIFNVGSEKPKKIIELINLLEQGTNKVANLKRVPKPDSDMVFTCSDNGQFRDQLGFYPKTSFEEGVKEFLNWYSSYKGVNSTDP